MNDRYELVEDIEVTPFSFPSLQTLGLGRQTYAETLQDLLKGSPALRNLYVRKHVDDMEYSFALPELRHVEIGGVFDPAFLKELSSGSPLLETVDVKFVALGKDYDGQVSSDIDLVVSRIRIWKSSSRQLLIQMLERPSFQPRVVELLHPDDTLGTEAAEAEAFQLFRRLENIQDLEKLSIRQARSLDILAGLPRNAKSVALQEYDFGSSTFDGLASSYPCNLEVTGNFIDRASSARHAAAIFGL
jgi:hypothetical protein